MKDPNDDSIRLAMDQAWRDHHHARDQTWKTVQIVAVLGAGLVTVDVQFGIPLATIGASILVVVTAIFGVMITVNHRKLERRKFIHIMNCEEKLGLHRDDLIPKVPLDGNLESKDELIRDAAVAVPKKFHWRDIIDPRENNTSLFILRIHIAIILFAVLLVTNRLIIGPLLDAQP